MIPDIYFLTSSDIFQRCWKCFKTNKSLFERYMFIQFFLRNDSRSQILIGKDKASTLQNLVIFVSRIRTFQYTPFEIEPCHLDKSIFLIIETNWFLLFWNISYDFESAGNKIVRLDLFSFFQQSYFQDTANIT